MRTFLSWHVVQQEQPLLSVKLDVHERRIHVTRGILCHAWEGYRRGRRHHREPRSRQMDARAGRHDRAGRVRQSPRCARRTDLPALASGHRYEPAAADLARGSLAGLCVWKSSITFTIPQLQIKHTISWRIGSVVVSKFGCGRRETVKLVEFTLRQIEMVEEFGFAEIVRLARMRSSG